MSLSQMFKVAVVSAVMWLLPKLITVVVATLPFSAPVVVIGSVATVAIVVNCN
ncbi:hypothetical protein C1H46_000414 [Malus baccata]|uniref:Uncharacterized protein n=1 Tax=Malus baccata TaxID=106549 RepID=A0A540NSH9_MALBA|nr:hypothetical protein C1H46_000414 [Malus baccata]